MITTVSERLAGLPHDRSGTRDERELVEASQRSARTIAGIRVPEVNAWDKGVVPVEALDAVHRATQDVLLRAYLLAEGPARSPAVVNAFRDEVRALRKKFQTLNQPIFRGNTPDGPVSVAHGHKYREQGYTYQSWSSSQAHYEWREKQVLKKHSEALDGALASLEHFLPVMLDGSGPLDRQEYRVIPPPRDEWQRGPTEIRPRFKLLGHSFLEREVQDPSRWVRVQAEPRMESVEAKLDDILARVEENSSEIREMGLRVNTVGPSEFLATRKSSGQDRWRVVNGRREY